MTDDAANLEPFVLPLMGRAERVRAVVEPVLHREGCELVNLHAIVGKTRSTLRLFIDTLEGGIGIGQLQQMNRLLGDLLDVEDAESPLFSGRYDLEVSSPGVDRPLTKQSHFEKTVGQKIKVKRQPGGPRRVHKGMLESATQTGITLADDLGDADDAGPVNIPYSDIKDAHILFDFSSIQGQPKKGSKQTTKTGESPTT